ncbi:transcriptional regulator [Bifidobacterium dolichotidis]|uniref:Transcriptional regulator n=1 Tax=Bifidobacterium dolichotidis TaxID=2306976 RepID=A0A430FT69_9BIFI|nr:transcriptional regulator [Bifidobacterium dolichotidis]RSX56094.1 transcriptional regulator [Bifidobacterium dolichotidis]
MSENQENRRALEELGNELFEEQLAYVRKPFMVLWAAVQEASAEVEEDYNLSPDLAQLWVADQLRRVSDSLVDRLAEKAIARGSSKSNVSRAAGAAPSNATRRFPRLKDNNPKERMLIDEVLDLFES